MSAISGPTALKNIAEPLRVYSVEVGKPAAAPKPKPAPGELASRRSRRRACSVARRGGGRGCRMVFVSREDRSGRCVLGTDAGGPFRDIPAVAILPFANATDSVRNTTHSPSASARRQETPPSNATIWRIIGHSGGAASEYSRPDRRGAAVERRLCRHREPGGGRRRAAGDVPGRRRLIRVRGYGPGRFRRPSKAPAARTPKLKSQGARKDC